MFGSVVREPVPKSRVKLSQVERFNLNFIVAKFLIKTEGFGDSKKLFCV